MSRNQAHHGRIFGSRIAAGLRLHLPTLILGMMALAPLANGQTRYGAAIPPLVPGVDPMIQGPAPTYGAPIYGAPVTPAVPNSAPTFWQNNPHGDVQPLPPVYGAPVAAGVPAAPIYGAPIYQQPAYGGQPITGEVIGGELLQAIDGAEGIVDSIAAPAEEELVEDVPPYNPVWYNPISWIGPYWDGSVEFGLSGSSGNSDSRNIRTGFDLSRETQRTNWDLDLVYNKNQANGEETQNNALLGSNWDFKMRNPRWTWFTKFGLEYDEFKNFDLRLSANTGLGYLLVDTDKTQFRPRFGAGISREFGGVDEDVLPEAVFGFDFSRQISSRQQFKATVDYFPAWEDFSNYRLLTDISWELVLDDVNNLSLKVGVIDRYDSTPNGAEANDVDYAVLLLWSL